MSRADQDANVTDDIRLYTIKAVAEALGCSPQHVYNLIYSGRLRAFSIGTGRAKLRVRHSSLMAYYADRERAATRVRPSVDDRAA